MGSSVVQLSVRDKALGWHEEDDGSRNVAIDKKWYGKMKKELLDTVYIKDLIDSKSGIIKKSDLNNPKKETIKKLKDSVVLYRNMHHAGKISKKANDEEIHDKKYWAKRTLEPLFKSKRCRALADILEIISNVKKSSSNASELTINHNIYKKLVRLIKAEKVGINLLDIIICGAVAPYNDLIGGKLVSMLLASPEIVQYVKKKYQNYPSIIASAIKGVPVYKNPELVFLGTTSLYGQGLNQYTRTSIPASIFDENKKNDVIRFKKLGLTTGWGNFHISNRTRDLARLYNERADSDEDVIASRVNYIFGEGVNPLTRMLNGTLQKLGYPPKNLLNHKSPRLVYGVDLISNMKEFLLGFNKRPKYLIPQNKPKQRTNQIVKYWMRRWLLKRMNNRQAVERIKSHSTSYPISHGAKVPLPKVDDDFGPLFSKDN